MRLIEVLLLIPFLILVACFIAWDTARNLFVRDSRNRQDLWARP